VNAPYGGAGASGAPASRRGDARTRLPREPYPGLRPFLDFEAALLFGRERQVREVIEHLKQTQFVAVLGGSGSGKSSLIHAGVVPELRSYGIPGAGDCWLPMTFTPGTNVSAADQAARRVSPVTRLARRFAGLLAPAADAAAADHRQREIAEVFRQDGGFARLIEAYGGQFALPPGPDPAEARVLFVIDQFEEIFHPTNQGVDDAKLLVERVLDHFFNPHPRCHVVLTMRSEHLNDCATFLELPDAINKSAYLIRRLDTDELRQAITGPAQRFLRLMARSEPDPERARLLPDQVLFDTAVIERVLRDVQAITHDPDHLPLMQHLLARVWEAALERAEMDMPVPAQITTADLARAVHAGAQGQPPPLDERTNTLRACVENWPETLYQWHDVARQRELDALFRHLAFKDPNTGLYSQQRLDVDLGAAHLGPGKTRADLRALIAEGFLGSVDYLFWDDEDPSRVTLKVSHESFIRGWARFRGLIDAESARFEEFLNVLRKCAAWSVAQRDKTAGLEDDFLLEEGELRRLADSGFAARLRQPEQRDSWRRFLTLDRDGARLARHEAELDRFFHRSRQRQAEREARESRARRSALWASVITVVTVLLPTTLFSWLVQGPTMLRAESLFDAGNRANRATLVVSQAKVGDAGGTLDSMLRAAELVEVARQGEGSWRFGLSRRLLEALGPLPFFNEQRDFLANVFSQAEPPVNSTLRGVLTGAVWLADAGELKGAEALTAPERIDTVACTAGNVAEDQVGALGKLWVSTRRNPADTRPLRALFLPERPSFDRKLELFAASVDPATRRCTLGGLVLDVPEVVDASVVFDATLRYFYYTLQGVATPVPSVVVQEVDWERGADGQLSTQQRQTLAVITDPAAVKAIDELLGDERAAAVPSWRVNGGRVVQVGTRRWRIAATQAQRVDLAASSPQVAALVASKPGSACVDLAATFAVMPGFDIEQLETERHCFMVARGWPRPAAAAGDSTPEDRPPRDELRVAVHDKPTGQLLARAKESPPAPVAGLVPFARLQAEDVSTEAGRWFVGTRGAYEGWLLLKVSDRVGGDRLIGAPWSTCALWRLGRDVQRANPAGASQAGLSKACER
jgi:energy-coupling factor transporter ATP-binding protein EcfA2